MTGGLRKIVTKPNPGNYVSPTPVEGVATWAVAPSEATAIWFRDRGFTVASMKVGLLISAPRETFEQVFNVNLTAKLPLAIRVPEALRQEIASITIPVPRKFRGNQKAVI